MRVKAHIKQLKALPIIPSGYTGGGSGLDVAAFNAYSANTQTDINNRLLKIIFNSYTGTTAPTLFASKSLFNSFTGSTNSRLGTIESNYVTGVTNLGTGNGLYTSISGRKAQLKSLVAGSNITLTPTSTGITISSTGGGSIPFTGVTNGLHIDSNKIKLGGTINDVVDLIMDATANQTFIIEDNQSTTSFFLGNGAASSSVGRMALIGGEKMIEMGSDNSFNKANKIVVTDSSATPTGIQYAASGYETNNLSLTSRGYVLGAKTYTGIQTFGSTGYALRNPANTFSYSILGAAITANRNITIPLITGNEFFVMTGFTQTLTNKTLGTGSKVLLGSDATGDIYYNGGSGTLTRLGAGANGYFLSSNGVGTAPSWKAVAVSGSSGGSGTGSTFAANGLNKVGNTIRLGGLLTGTTNISGISLNFIVSGLTIGDGGVSPHSNLGMYNFIGGGGAGGNYVTANSSFVYGFSNIVTGSTTRGVFVSGNGHYVSGPYAHVEGNGNVASGSSSPHVEGGANKGGGLYAHAEGNNTYAYNLSGPTHAEGKGTYSTGQYSHAQGFATKASGNGSHAGGTGQSGGINKEVTSDGLASFNHSQNSASQTAGHGALATASAILGGADHNLPSGNLRSAIIGGNTIKATASVQDTVFMPKVRIGLGTGGALPTGGTLQLIGRNNSTGELTYATGIDSLANALTITGTTGVLTLARTTGQLLIKSRNSVNLQGFSTANVLRTQLKISATGATFTDSRTGTTAAGIQYAADYSANYTPRSHVDKGYVTGLTSNLIFQSFTVAGLPSATVPARMIYVSNESGGATMAFSDGTNWRRVHDRAIVS